MFISINNHLLKVDDIEAAYPCDCLGNKEDDNERFTYIIHRGGFKGVYDINYCELVEMIKKHAEEA